jgi:hypothetical protein
VVRQDVFEVFPGRVQLVGLGAQGLDAFLDDVGPTPIGFWPGQDVADLFEAHPA